MRSQTPRATPKIRARLGIDLDLVIKANRRHSHTAEATVRLTTAPGERLAGFERRNAFGKFRCELLNSFGQPLCRLPTWASSKPRLFR